MIYQISALSQFLVIILTAVASACGWLAASTALVICVAVSLFVVVHSLMEHARGWPS